MLVIDSNAALVMASGTAEGLALSALILKGEKIIAPKLLLAETANAVWKRVNFGFGDLGDNIAYLEFAFEIVDEYYDDNSLLIEALSEAITARHPVYDMLYLVLARRTGATLATFDKKLRSIASERGVNCIDMLDF